MYNVHVYMPLYMYACNVEPECAGHSCTYVWDHLLQDCPIFFLLLPVHIFEIFGVLVQLLLNFTKTELLYRCSTCDVYIYIYIYIYIYMSGT
jgi:hypothetical protein